MSRSSLRTLTPKAVKIISILSSQRKLFSHLSFAFFNRSPQIRQIFPIFVDVQREPSSKLNLN